MLSVSCTRHFSALPVVGLSCALLLLAGCTSGRISSYLPAVGSEVVVNEALEASSGNRIALQNGAVMDRRDINNRVANCEFRVRRANDATGSVSVQPDTFTVTRVFRELRRGTVNATMVTFMNLSSENQPDVHQLLCQRFGEPNWKGFVSLEEMQTTVGPLVNLDFLIE